ncbi:MAG TPA: molecular chaperone [Pseudomonadales bacterium]|nr:molecular chaperone [Pseudomonadales bacterium]
MYAGFDYGTSNCSIGLLRDGAVRLAPLEDAETLIPSTLYAPRPQQQLERSIADIRGLDVRTRALDELRFGRAALAAYLEAPSAGYFVKSPKSFLGAKGLSEEIKDRFVGVVAAMMANVKRGADAAAGESIRQVVIGRPINFQGAGGDEENRNALAMLTEAARDAGFVDIEFLFEPMAAAMEYEARLEHEECVLVLDIGGGTTDCSFVRVGPKRRVSLERHADILGHAGERIGGNDYDQLLALRAIMALLGFGDALTSGLPIPNTYFVDAVSTNDVNAQQRFYSRQTRERLDRMVGEAQRPERLARLRAVQTERLSYRIVRSAELAKVALSDTELAAVDLSYLEDGLAGSTDRAQFQQSCERLLVHLHGLVAETVTAAGRQPDVIYLTGGMARATIVRRYLEAEFPTARFVDSDHFASVTEGLTLWAQRLFG